MKLTCKDCGWTGIDGETMILMHSIYDSFYIQNICPRCREVKPTTARACEYEGCWDEANFHLTKDGEHIYMCSKHLKE